MKVTKGLTVVNSVDRLTVADLHSKILDVPPSKFLPPANEVWSKVMFLRLSVSHSVRSGH